MDLTRIDGISLQTAQKVFFEIGTDVGAWDEEKRFTSWLGLSPNHCISGGKVLKRSSRKVVNPLSVALRLAARTLNNSHSALGANFRRLTAKIAMPKAITAMARKLAVLVYRMLKYGTQYVDKGMQHYQSKYQATKVHYLRAQAAKLGMILLPKQPAGAGAARLKEPRLFRPKIAQNRNTPSSSLSARSSKCSWGARFGEQKP